MIVAPFLFLSLLYSVACRVYHIDGSYSLAYNFGEYQYTFSLDERNMARKAYFEQRAEASKRKALLDKINKLDTETLQKIVEIIEK